MENKPPDINGPGSPAPEVLHPREEAGAAEGSKGSAAQAKPEAAQLTKRLHLTHRPSNKATFIGISIVIAILVINAAIIGFIASSQHKKNNTQDAQVTVSESALNKLGVNRGSNDAGIELTVGPNAQFKGNLTVAGNTSIGGQLNLNSKFTATDASLAQVEAGNTTLGTLNVNGSSTLSSAALRNNLSVAGTTTLQGPVTMTQLLTVSNNVNISGNVSVGGTLSLSNLHIGSLTADSLITIGGHVVTNGSAPGLSKGSCLSSLDTVSNSGNDAAGTVVVNVDSSGLNNGHSACIVANVSFRQGYSNIPHVVVTPVGPVFGGNVYVYRSAGGFSIGISGSLDAGSSTAFDYIVEQ